MGAPVLHRPRTMNNRPFATPPVQRCAVKIKSKQILQFAIPRRPGLDSARVLVPSRQKAPAHKPDIRPAKFIDSASRKTGLPQNTHATELRHRSARPCHRSIIAIALHADLKQAQLSVRPQDRAAPRSGKKLIYRSQSETKFPDLCRS